MKITELPSLYDDLELKTTRSILEEINREDHTIADAVKLAIPQIEKLIEAILPRFNQGGRLFFLGAGTSGRLAVLDASELPPTYGLPADRVIGLIAGGDKALRTSVEHAEDDDNQGWRELRNFNINQLDTVIGIAASGTTPYVTGALHEARLFGCITACITNNPDSPLENEALFPVVVITGPEYVTGSTRMKAGTAQKLTLNMISTTLMIRCGRVKGNKMVNMKPTNNKLLARGVTILQELLSIDCRQATELLHRHGSVKAAIDSFNTTRC
jgi:N-acetylmuramic acid 6-phosphate etherase